MNKILPVCILMCAHTTIAIADVIDFEGLAAGTIIDDEYASVFKLRVDNLSHGPDVGVIFDTLHPTGGDWDLGGPFDSNNAGLPDRYNAGNVLIIHENHTCDTLRCDNPDDEGSRPAGKFIFDFTEAVRLESIDFFDVETAENGESWKNAIRLFDTMDNEILPGRFYTPDTGGDRMWDRLLFTQADDSLGIDGVSRMELSLGGSGAIDNITYSVIPIPSAIWLFGTGLIALAATARRRA